MTFWIKLRAKKRFLVFTQAPPLDQCVAFYQSILLHGHCQYFAELDGSVIGWCDVLPVRGEVRAHVGELGIGLIPSARHQGIGQMLIRASIEKAWAKRLTRIELSVRADNANAKALYERMGFQTEGIQRRAVLVDDDHFDLVSMALLR